MKKWRLNQDWAPNESMHYCNVNFELDFNSGTISLHCSTKTNSRRPQIKLQQLHLIKVESTILKADNYEIKNVLLHSLKTNAVIV